MQTLRGGWQRAEGGLTATVPAGWEGGVLSLPASRMNHAGHGIDGRKMANYTNESNSHLFLRCHSERFGCDCPVPGLAHKPWRGGCNRDVMKASPPCHVAFLRSTGFVKRTTTARNPMTQRMDAPATAVDFNNENANTSANPTFESVLGARLSRRGLLRGSP